MEEDELEVEAGNHKNGNGIIYPEEVKEEEYYAAAQILVSMKLSKLKHNELQKLEEVINGNYLPKLVVERLKGFIGQCSKPFEKQLTNSDVADGQSRLSLVPKERVQTDFIPLLDSNEKLLLVDRRRLGIEVTIYDWQGKEYPMIFKLWLSSNMHVLTTGWKSFCKDHSLMPRLDFLTIWMFRHTLTRKLCFAITRTRRSNSTTQASCSQK